ncbi:unnamed protein product [Protopolystoma xenopodis]|uniref:Uncharacterized protein n=1 Tax=Protopolystoma xenopodis TaxID=117903 RepID=A0A448XIF2_9PLAT|nr:unnamed protein product [Protopolystoma xenopodis]
MKTNESHVLNLRGLFISPSLSNYYDIICTGNSQPSVRKVEQQLTHNWSDFEETEVPNLSPSCRTSNHKWPPSQRPLPPLPLAARPIQYPPTRKAPSPPSVQLSPRQATPPPPPRLLPVAQSSSFVPKSTTFTTLTSQSPEQSDATATPLTETPVGRDVLKPHTLSEHFIQAGLPNETQISTSSVSTHLSQVSSSDVGMGQVSTAEMEGFVRFRILFFFFDLHAILFG